jgi:CCR4-NOT transcription complex subunit 4
MISNGDESLYNILNNIRIVKENLVYIIGISPKIAEEKVTAIHQALKSPQLMGQYGNIEKCIINRNKEYTPKNSIGPCYSAYITYSSARDAAIAILVKTLAGNRHI